MGHKSNPIGLRLQINRTWDSRWYAEGANYRQMLKEDLAIRKYVVENLPQAAISKVVIERPAKLCRVSIYAARPGVIIGKKAEEAMNILAFSKRALAKDASKVLASAIANAENNHNLDVDALVVAEASVGKAITMKRFHTRGRGKSTRILKPFSRLRIVVREVEEA